MMKGHMTPTGFGGGSVVHNQGKGSRPMPQSGGSSHFGKPPAPAKRAQPLPPAVPGPGTGMQPAPIHPVLKPSPMAGPVPGAMPPPPMPAPMPGPM